MKRFALPGLLDKRSSKWTPSSPTAVDTEYCSGRMPGVRTYSCSLPHSYPTMSHNSHWSTRDSGVQASCRISPTLRALLAWSQSAAPSLSPIKLWSYPIRRLVVPQNTASLLGSSKAVGIFFGSTKTVSKNRGVEISEIVLCSMFIRKTFPTGGGLACRETSSIIVLYSAVSYCHLMKGACAGRIF